MDAAGSLSAAVHDPARVAAVKRTGLLDTGAEESFDRLTRLAARLLDAPVALMSLVDDHRQFFKSQVELSEPHASARQTPLSLSICQYTALSSDPLVIDDARLVPELEDNGAIGELGAIAYLGCPLIDDDGYTLGSFCVIDNEPRAWTPSDVEVLSGLAASAMSEISLRMALHDRDRLASVLEVTPDLVLITDASGRTHSMNAAARRTLTDVDLAAEGVKPTMLFPPESAQLLCNEAIPAAAGDGVWSGEVELIGRDSIIPASVVIVGQSDGGEVDTFTIVARDLLAEVQAEQRTVSSELRLRHVLDSLAIFVGALTVDGVLTEANRAALLSADLDSTDIVGRPFWETYWWTWDADVQQLIRDAVERCATGKSSRFDVEARVGDGELLPIDFQIVPLRDGDGSIIGMVPSGIDISQRKEFERELARLARVEGGHRQVAEALFDTAEALARCATVDDIASCVVEFAGKVVDAAFANIAVAVPEAQTMKLWHGEGLDADIENRWPLVDLDTSTPLGHAVVHDEPVWLPTPAEIADGFPSGAADSVAAGLHALAAVPIPGADAALGFAWAGDPGDRQQILARLLTVAEMCGQAIERARLYERERMVAHELQARMLPASLTTIPDVSMAARYLPGEAGMDVGGDWYDSARLGSDRFVVAVGDIVGHGLDAAAAMGRVRTAFSALAMNARDVADLVEQLDRFAAGDEVARLSTLIAVEVDAKTRSIECSSAGHVPIMIRRADGLVETIFSTGPPLGFDVDVARRTTTTTLAPGDTLLLYTDGLVERPGEGIDEGLGRLAAALEDASTTSAEAVCDAIIESIGGVGSDDIAMLVLRG